MLKNLTLAAALALGGFALTAPAFAQEHGDHDDHQGHEHGDDHHHDGDAGEKAASLQKADVEVDVLGMVCDFCAISMEKTFKKREEVAGVSVDLDTKVLAIAFKPGASLDDKMIEKLVTRSGYKTAKIRRKAA